MIWRRVLVPGEFTLAALHEIIPRVMPWGDEHLHELIIDGVGYRRTRREIHFRGPKLLNEGHATLKEVLPDLGRSFQYEYDFGDSWLHEIKVEKILFRDEGTVYSVCVGGENVCPPEDSGGIFGYYNKLEAANRSLHSLAKKLAQ